MKTIQGILSVAVVLLLVVMSGCKSNPVEGNEGGAQLTKTETYDQVRSGARLQMAYDTPSNTFTGTVENTTSNVLTRVRVEIHLSNGTELGPTTPTDLTPGQVLNISLPATSQPFATWSPHAEVGSGEGGGEGSGEGSGGS